MTMTSIGYDGATNEQAWARLGGYLGRSPCVADSAAWKVTAVVGPDRTVRVAAGVGYGDGIHDTSDATVDVQLATIAAGTRWDTLVARRDWTPTPGGGTAFAAVSGVTAQAVAAGLLDNPGVNADQPLALVQLTAGSSTPTAVVDLRAVPTHTVTYPSTLALPAGAPVGAVAAVAGDMYVKQVGGWVLDPAVDTGWISTAGFTALTGFTITEQKARRKNGVVAIFISLTSAEALPAGNMVNKAFLTIPLGWRPAVSNGHLGAGTFGPGFSAHASIHGTIIMTSADQSLGAGGGMNVLGSWML